MNMSLLRLLARPLVPADWKPETWDGTKNVKSIKRNLLSEAECLRGWERLRESRRDTRWRKMDCSLPGSSIHGIFHARVLEWGAIAFSHIYAQACLNN